MRTVISKDIPLKPAIDEVHTEGGRKRIVIVIPGIRTNADWVNDAASQMQLMSADSVEFVKAADGRISTWKLVTRIGLGSIRNNIRTQIANFIIRKLVNNEDVSISLLCHSLGTDIAADIVETIDYDFEHIILLGAVCSKEKIITLSRSCDYLTNIRGTMDQYPLIASMVRPDVYGVTGTFGASNPNVGEVRWEYDHASCTEWESIKNVVIPIVELGTKIDGTVRKSFCFTHYTYSNYLFKITGFLGLFLGIFSLIFGGIFISIMSILILLLCFASVAQYFIPKTTIKILKSIIAISKNSENRP